MMAPAEHERVSLLDPVAAAADLGGVAEPGLRFLLGLRALDTPCDSSCSADVARWSAISAAISAAMGSVAAASTAPLSGHQASSIWHAASPG